jgi:glycosyltransferase involved in cell wall biosynthesis
MKISVVTITRNRQNHLFNLMRGLHYSTTAISELIVVVMGGEDPAQYAAIQQATFSFQIKYYYLNQEGLPLARARNCGLEQASSDFIIFLDVDCIPSSHMVHGYLHTYDLFPNAILMGQVNYLPEGYVVHNFRDLDQSQGLPHPGRNYREIAVIEDYNLFWSLAFAGKKKLFQTIGGFDEAFHGYGAEDTDFSYMAHLNNIPLIACPEALCFHQYHDSFSPPLNHFRDIVKNAEVFYKKWQKWPMQAWLDEFLKLKLISPYHSQDRIEILKDPTPEEIESTRKSC